MLKILTLTLALSACAAPVESTDDIDAIDAPCGARPERPTVAGSYDDGKLVYYAYDYRVMAEYLDAIEDFATCLGSQ